MVFIFVGDPAKGLTRDAERIGFCVLAAIVALLVCGCMAIAEEMQPEAAGRP